MQIPMQNFISKAIDINTEILPGLLLFINNLTYFVLKLNLFFKKNFKTQTFYAIASYSKNYVSEVLFSVKLR